MSEDTSPREKDDFDTLRELLMICRHRDLTFAERKQLRVVLRRVKLMLAK